MSEPAWCTFVDVSHDDESSDESHLGSCIMNKKVCRDAAAGLKSFGQEETREHGKRKEAPKYLFPHCKVL